MKKKGLFVEYKGYKLTQSYYNHHYLIFDNNDELVIHAQCTEPLTENEAKQQIETYIQSNKVLVKEEI